MVPIPQSDLSQDATPEGSDRLTQAVIDHEGIDDEVIDFFKPDAPPQHFEPGDSQPEPVTSFPLLGDRPVLQAPNSLGLAPSVSRDTTVVQYYDSAIHRPANPTIAQGFPLLAGVSTDQTVFQRSIVPVSQNTGLGSSSAAIVPQSKSLRPTLTRLRWRGGSLVTLLSGMGHHLRQGVKRFHYRRLLSMRPKFPRWVRPSRTRPQQPMSKLIPSRAGKGAADDESMRHLYYKTLQELDHCRLSFAKELARNGKFREAIAVASQIVETSCFFTDAQVLLRSWEKL